MTEFEFVVSNGAPKRASTAARSHAVKNGLQRKSNAGKAKDSQDSQLIIKQRSTLKTRFRLSPSSSKPAVCSTTEEEERHPPVTRESQHHAPKTDGAKDSSSKQVVRGDITSDWDPIGSSSFSYCPSQSRGDPFNSFPIDQPTGVDKLLRFFAYQPNDEVSVYEIRKSWWAFAQSDAAVLHATLGVAAVAWAMVLPDPWSACGEGHRQKGLAIQRIQEKLRDGDKSDALIGAIANLANMEGLQGDFEAALVHLKGVKMILNARGGHSDFRDKMHIARALNWADLQASTALNTKPMLNIIYDLDSVNLAPHILAKAEQPSLSHLKRFEASPDDASVQFMFTLLRQTYHAAKTSEVSATEKRTLINAVDYRLSNMLASNGQSPQGHTLLLAARIFLYRVLREANTRCLIPMIIVERLKCELQTRMDEMASNQDYWHGLLWCLCMGTSCSPDSSDVWEFFSTNMWDIVQMAGNSRRAEVEEILESFLWDGDTLGGLLDIPRPSLFPFWV